MIIQQFIYPVGKRTYHHTMGIDIFEIRRQNLISIVAPRGEAAALAAQLKIEANYISQVKTCKKRMGEDIARRIEEARGLGYAWMDVTHDDSQKDKPVVIEASSPEDLATKLSEYDAQKMLDILQMAMKLKEQGKLDD
jgi:hypothetical protein